MKAKTKGMMSFGEIRDLVCNAICAKEGAGYLCYIVDIFPDAVVYESCGADNEQKYYQRTYVITTGEVTLGDAVEVEKQVEYVPMQAACTIVAAAAGDTTGFKWRVRVAKFGPDKNGNYWDQDVITASLAKFEGAKIFALAEGQHQAKPHPFGKSVRDLVGVLQSAAIEADGIYANLIILPSALWLRDNLTACKDLGLDNVIGLSVDVNGKIGTKKIGDKKYPYLATIFNVTVDVVYDPAAGGQFIKMAAAVEAGQKGDTEMFAKLLAALKGTRPELYIQIQAGITAGTLTEDQALEQIAAATVKDAGGDATNQQITAAVVEGLKKILIAGGDPPELIEMRQLVAAQRINTALTTSLLPTVCQDDLRARFASQCPTDEQLQAAIKTEKEKIDKLTGSGVVHGSGDVRIAVGREGVDKLQAAFDGMLGVTIADNMRDVPTFRSIRAAYTEMTGDVDVTGILTPQQQRRMQAAYGDTTFAYVLGNTLYRRMSQDYRALPDYGVSRLVGPNIRNAVDFRPLETVRVGYYGDLPLVNTDVEDYPDLGEVSDEKIEHALKERGGLITINRRTLINDDMRLIQRILSRLPRAARRTVARSVWTPFLTNAVYKGDNKAIFHVDHGNLSTAAYAIASAEAAKTAMFNQLEPESAEKLGLVPVTVAFPSELRALVSNVNNFNPQAVAVENGNSMFQFFKAEGMFQNPLQTDTTDWMMFADPNEVEIVELAFLNGQQEPVMVVADNPANGQMFVGGRIQYRITHDHSAEPTDFRGAHKSVVAGG